MSEISARFIKGIIGTDDILLDGVPQVAFVGRSNVGKSSVINALTGQRDLVKVGKKPGKTTEINFFLIRNRFYFVDLPGYGYAQLTPSEREKIRKRIIWYVSESGARPRCIALVVDIRVGVTPFDLEMVGLVRECGHPLLVIANKIDKVSQKELHAQLKKIHDALPEATVLPYSAVEPTANHELYEALGVS